MADYRFPNNFHLITFHKDYLELESDDVVLPCQVYPEASAVTMTIRWFKYEECIYLYKNGQVRESSGYEGRVSLITQELEKGNVSLRIKNMKESDEGVYICQVVYGAQKEEAAVGLGTRGEKPGTCYIRPVPASAYLHRETQEKKLRREESATQIG
ncbi:hypothetical protein DPEC_G00054510 [Dallia pectoralis]|uniref:Uncharacterized protein n=1 Tax=Dallia pectoralis TaxID=75939 RepID=A0ACC2H523_DALPE|nr:hypothetical protein DPEC_G00054510 [Dallia pectoralis]